MAAAIMGDATEAMGGEEKHLRFPRIRIERPSVAESDRLSVFRAPVFVVNRRAVFGGDGAHVDMFFQFATCWAEISGKAIRQVMVFPWPIGQIRRSGLSTGRGGYLLRFRPGTVFFSDERPFEKSLLSTR